MKKMIMLGEDNFKIGAKTRRRKKKNEDEDEKYASERENKQTNKQTNRKELAEKDDK